MEHHGVGVAVQAAGQRCVLLTTAEPGGPGPAAAPAAGPQTPGQLSLILCDALGSPCGSVQLAGGAGLPAGPDAGGGAGEADAHAATGCWVLDMGACAGKQARFSAI